MKPHRFDIVDVNPRSNCLLVLCSNLLELHIEHHPSDALSLILRFNSDMPNHHLISIGQVLVGKKEANNTPLQLSYK